MGVLIQLPVPQLQNALTICPELRVPLLEYAREMNKHQISNNVSQQVLDLLTGTTSEADRGGSKPMDEGENIGKPPGVD